MTENVTFALVMRSAAFAMVFRIAAVSELGKLDCFGRSDHGAEAAIFKVVDVKVQGCGGDAAGPSTAAQEVGRARRRGKSHARAQAHA